jgi:hypothetical protein
MLDLNALSTPVKKCLAFLEEGIEKGKKATDNVFYIHAELVETASVLFLRQIASGHSSIAVPGEDRDVIQLLRLPRQRRPPENLQLLPQSGSKSNFMSHLGTVHDMGPFGCSVCRSSADRGYLEQRQEEKSCPPQDVVFNFRRQQQVCRCGRLRHPFPPHRLPYRLRRQTAHGLGD